MINKKAKTDNFWRMIFFFSVLLLSMLALMTLPRLSIPLSISYIIYLVFSPLIPVLTRFGMSKNIAIFTIIALLGVLTLYPVFKLAPKITSEAQNFETYVPKIENYIQTEYQKISLKIKDKTGYQLSEEYIQQALNWGKTGIASFALKVPKFLASAIEWIFLIPLYVFFFLKDGRTLRNLILKITPNSVFERFYYLSHKFNSKLGDYIFAKFIEASIVGAIITIGLLVMDVRFSFIFGFVAAITNVIPYLGPVIGSLPGIIFVLAEYGTGPTSGGVIFLFLIANAIDIGLVFPILVSKIVDLHPIVVVISVILGSQALGVLGMVISIPLAAAVKLIVLEIYGEIYARRIK